MKRKKNELLRKLFLLNDLYLCIHASDLHGKNVRLAPNGDIYVIDLEVIDHRQETLLTITNNVEDLEKLRDEAMKKLKNDFPEKDIEKMIEDFKTDIGVFPKKFLVPIRHVLLNTDAFRKLMKDVLNPENTAEKITTEIIESMKTRNLNVKAGAKKIIKNRVYKDIVNADVPFFTEIGGKVYYGHAEDKDEIGSVRALSKK